MSITETLTQWRSPTANVFAKTNEVYQPVPKVMDEVKKVEEPALKPYVCAFSGTSGVSCCGFQEVFGYRIGTQRKRGDHIYIDDESGHYSGGRVRATEHVWGEGDTKVEAVKDCLQKYIEHVQRSYCSKHYPASYAAMRTFQILYRTEDAGGECYTPELRDALLDLNCEKSVLTYVNANTGRKIDAISLAITKNTKVEK